jgi:predicted nucleotide-binding protein
VVFDENFHGYLGVIPAKPKLRWLSSDEFNVPFQYWHEQLEARRDVFLGYCSSSVATAAKVKHYLEDQLQLSVLDLAEVFDPSPSGLLQIEEAEEWCGAGLFLFTKDDGLSGGSGDNKAAPRDNVVFEAAYFSALEGKSKVLIVRESGAKMPADLVGDIYAVLKDKTTPGRSRRC